MSKPPKVTSVFAASVLAHLVSFMVLALMPEPHSALANKEIDQKAIDKPLEVVLQTAPVAPPAPEPAELLDPELKHADRAPENTKRLAAHDSLAANPKRGQGSSGAPHSSGTPAALSTVAVNSPVLAVHPLRIGQGKGSSAAKGGAPDGTGPDEEFGIDAVGSYYKAVREAIAASCKAKGGMAVGEVDIEFAIDPKGTVSRFRVVADNGNPENAQFVIRAIREAKLPPVPPNLLAQLPGDRKFFKRSYTFFRIPTP